MNGDDIPELCCAAGACCDAQKRRRTLARLIERYLRHQGLFVPPHDTILAIADYIHGSFDLVPAGLGFATFVYKFGEMIRGTTYSGEGDHDKSDKSADGGAAPDEPTTGG